MRVTFTEVEISFDADSPEEAYTKLEQGMEALGFTVAGPIDWSSGNYHTSEDSESRDTVELFD